MAEPVLEPTAATSPGAVAAAGLEVATLSADTLRAGIRVTGALLPHTSALLVSILRTHVCSGRRYLRVDLSDAEVGDPAVIEQLVDAHRSIAELGGMLVFENAGPRVVDAIRGADLFVQPSD